MPRIMILIAVRKADYINHNVHACLNTAQAVLYALALFF